MRGSCMAHSGISISFPPLSNQQAWGPPALSGRGLWETRSDCGSWCDLGLAWREHMPILTDAGLLLRLRSAITQDINTVRWGQAGAARAPGNGKRCTALWRLQRPWQAPTDGHCVTVGEGWLVRNAGELHWEREHPENYTSTWKGCLVLQYRRLFMYVTQTCRHKYSRRHKFVLAYRRYGCTV